MLIDDLVPDALTLARLAAEEGIDRRTLRRRLRGEPVRGLAGARADRAVAKLRALQSATNPEPNKAA
jgi:hypothetical protein